MMRNTEKFEYKYRLNFIREETISTKSIKLNEAMYAKTKLIKKRCSSIHDSPSTDKEYYFALNISQLDEPGFFAHETPAGACLDSARLKFPSR